MHRIGRLLFLYPPQADYYLPPLGPACLFAFLKRHRPDWYYRFMDLNVDHVHWLLHPEQIATAYSTVLDAFERGCRSASLEPETLAEMQATISTLQAARDVLSAPKPLVDYLIDPQIVSDRARFEAPKKAVGHMMHLHSLVQGQVMANPENMIWVEHGVAAWESAHLLDILAQPDLDPYIPFLKAKPELEHEIAQCDTLLISVNYYEQMLGAFSTAAFAKRLRPDLPVVMGGSWITAIRTNCMAVPDLFDYVDVMIPYAGEASLLEALQRLDRGESLVGSPNAMTRQGDTIAFQEAANFPRMETLPVPDFDHYTLDRYLLPEPVLPFQLTRGCYWGQCTFCTHHMAQGLGYSVAKTPVIGERLASLVERYSTHRFYFVDEAIPPTKLREIPEALEAHHLDILWMSECRLERSLTRETFDRLAASGCRLLLFGLETGSQRVMDAMQKGTQIEMAQRCLRDCAEAGIDTSLFLMFGFPTETIDDVLTTYRFLKTNQPWITTLGTSVFTLTAESPIADDPARFSVVLEKELVRGLPLKEDLAYQVTEGLDHETAEQVCEWFQQTDVYQAIMRNRPYLRRSHALFVPSRFERELSTAVGCRDRLMAPEYTTLSSLHMDISAVKTQFPSVAEGKVEIHSTHQGAMRQSFTGIKHLTSSCGVNADSVIST